MSHEHEFSGWNSVENPLQPSTTCVNMIYASYMITSCCTQHTYCRMQNTEYAYLWFLVCCLPERRLHLKFLLDGGALYLTALENYKCMNIIFHAGSAISGLSIYLKGIWNSKHQRTATNVSDLVCHRSYCEHTIAIHTPQFKQGPP